MSITIEYEADQKLGVDYEGIIHRVVEKVLEYEECPYEIEMGIVLTDNQEIHRMNKEFRGVDDATDVLSFPMLSYERPSDFSKMEADTEANFNPETGELLMGDIVLSVERIVLQAEEYGHSIERELAFLTAHSMLHLCGYDHMVHMDRLLMEGKQEDILNALGIRRD